MVSARQLLIDNGMGTEDLGLEEAAVRNVARNLRKAALSMEASSIATSNWVKFVASEILPPLVLDRMTNYKHGDLAIVRPMLFCPGKTRGLTAAGEEVDGICYRIAADVTNKFRLLTGDGATEVNGYFCARCARWRKPNDPPPPCRLLYMWWKGKPENARPLQLVLEDIGATQMPDKGPSSAGLGKAVDELEGTGKEKTLGTRAGEAAGKMPIIRLKFSGDKAKAIWEYLCDAAAAGH